MKMIKLNNKTKRKLEYKKCNKIVMMKKIIVGKVECWWCPNCEKHNN